MSMRSSVLFCAALTLVALDFGCATKTAQVKPKAKDDDEWVTLPPATGSYLPRRVRKSDLRNSSVSSSELLVVAGTGVSQGSGLTGASPSMPMKTQGAAGK
jgi:hypothetical protein